MRRLISFVLMAGVAMAPLSCHRDPGPDQGLVLLAATSQALAGQPGGVAQSEPQIGLSSNGSQISSGGTSSLPALLVGAASAPQVFTIVNSGRGSLVIRSVSFLDGEVSQFALDASALPSSLAPSGSATFTVVFRPTVAGMRTARVVVRSNDPVHPDFVIALSGEGQAVPAPRIQVRYGSVDARWGLSMGGVRVCSTGRDYAMTIANRGTLDLSLTGSPVVSVSGPNASEFTITSQPAVSLIPAGGTADFVVHFNPTNSSQKTVTLAIASNDPTNPVYTFSLSASRENSAMQVYAGSNRYVAPGSTVNLGYIWSGGSTSLPFSVKNQGLASLYLTGSPVLQFSGPNAGIVTAIPPVTIIDPISEQPFTLSLNPAGVGEHLARISIENDDCDHNPYVFDVSARGYSASQATASAAWSVRRGHSSVAFGGELWVLGGDGDPAYLGDVYSSSDGVNWVQRSANTIWVRSAYHASVVFDGKMWMLGGTGIGYSNSVAYSSDGVTWAWATEAAPWAGRDFLAAVVFDGKIWVLGGRTGRYGSNGHYSDSCTNDVWYSADGANWTQATAHAGWSARCGHTAAVLGNKMWVMGGNNGSVGGQSNDVWYSSDGVTWTQATGAAPWGKRSAHATVVYSNALWVIGGYSGNESLYGDMWSSTDGVTWFPVDGMAPRDSLSAAVFNEKIWMMGGLDSLGFRVNNVVTFRDH